MYPLIQSEDIKKYIIDDYINNMILEITCDENLKDWCLPNQKECLTMLYECGSLEAILEENGCIFAIRLTITEQKCTKTVCRNELGGFTMTLKEG